MIKKFIYSFLRFSLLPLAILLLLEISIGLNRKSLFTEKKLENLFRHSADAYGWMAKINHPSKILLLGSSSVKYGLSCTLLNKLSNDSLAFINLAADARDPVETYFILKQTNLTNVKAIYMGIDPWIFAKRYYKNRNSYFYLDMNPLTAVRYSLEHDAKLLPLRYKKFFSSFFSSYAGVKNIKQPVPVDFGSAALTKNPVNFNDQVHKKFQLEKYGWSTLQFEFLQKIVTLCLSRNISFTAFYPPKRSDFITDYKTYGSEIHASFLAELKKTGFYSSISGSFSSMQPGGDSLFADAYHLNVKGQQVYSKMFWETLVANNFH